MIEHKTLPRVGVWNGGFHSWRRGSWSLGWEILPPKTTHTAHAARRSWNFYPQPVHSIQLWGSVRYRRGARASVFLVDKVYVRSSWCDRVDDAAAAPVPQACGVKSITPRWAAFGLIMSFNVGWMWCFGADGKFFFVEEYAINQKRKSKSKMKQNRLFQLIWSVHWLKKIKFHTWCVS